MWKDWLVKNSDIQRFMGRYFFVGWISSSLSEAAFLYHGIKISNEGFNILSKISFPLKKYFLEMDLLKK